MTKSQLRVRNALDHRSGELAVDFGGTVVSGMHVSIVAALRDYYGLDSRPVRLVEPYQMLGEIDDELAGILDVDTVSVLAPRTIFGFENTGWREWRAPWGQVLLVPADFRIRESDGDVLIFPEGDGEAEPSGRLPEGGYYFDSIIRQPPIGELDPRDNLEEFGSLSDADLEYYRRSVEEAEKTGRAVIVVLPGTGLGDIALVPAPFLKSPKGIRDVEEWYISTVSRPDYLHAIFDEQSRITIENFRRIYDVVGDVPAVAFVCGTDFGTQSSTFCSAETFRTLYLPYYKRMNGWIHEHTSWKTFKHSCGSVADFMPLFIEAEFDIVNPVQLSAAGMDAGDLKREYGDSLVFWGGGVDTQRTLPFGTPEEVTREVKTRIEALAGNGGFVFNAIHNVQAKTPVENIAAMFSAARS